MFHNNNSNFTKYFESVTVIWNTAKPCNFRLRKNFFDKKTEHVFFLGTYVLPLFSLPILYVLPALFRYFRPIF